MAYPSDRNRPLSAILRDIGDDPSPHVTLGEMVQRFGPRAFGALLFAIAIPNLLPLPPGSSTILGMPLFILSPQIAVGFRGPWLPKWLERRPLPRADLKRAFDRVTPTLVRIEKISRPRLTWLFGPIGDRVIGVCCTALAFILILPIPLGNLLPSIVIGLFGLALVTRDGVLALVTYALTATSAGLIVAGIGIGIRMLMHVLGVIGWV